MCAKQVQWRRGTTAQHTSFIGANCEVTVDTTKKTLVVHDGVTAGGSVQATEKYVNDAIGTIDVSSYVNKSYVDGLNAQNVKLTGNQTVAGIKTFSSTITGSITGNAGTATKLATDRTINGVAFNGTANITIADETKVALTGNQTIAGVKTFSSSPIVPTPTTATQVANKAYVDRLGQPTHTGTATFTATDNKIVMTGIVSALDLEVGDVIQFTSGTDANNAKMRTVESIINNNEIVVNYEHCGARGNGSLKLSNKSGISCTVKRVAKYYNAPLGLGQGWVNVLSFRIYSTSYSNSLNRAIGISIMAGNSTLSIYSNGAVAVSSSVTSSALIGVSTTLPTGTYRAEVTSELTIVVWTELR